MDKSKVKLPEKQCEIIGTSLLGNDEARWLKLKAVDWKDRKGHFRKWELCSRSTRHGQVDAVSILPLLDYGKNSSEPLTTVLVSQFRPAIGKYCLEMAAGLADPNEDPETTALRELREETGLIGQPETCVKSIVGYNDPGLTDANMRLVTVRVDMTRAENINAKQQLDEGEDIDLHKVRINDLLNTFSEFEKAGFAIDGRLLHFAIGYEHSKLL